MFTFLDCLWSEALCFINNRHGGAIYNKTFEEVQCSAVVRMTTTLRLLLLSTFLVFVLSAPNFFLIDTGVDWQDEQVKEVASPQEESKERNDADYQR